MNTTNLQKADRAEIELLKGAEKHKERNLQY